MTRTTVDRIVLALLGIVLAVAGAYALLADTGPRSLYLGRWTLDLGWLPLPPTLATLTAPLRDALVLPTAARVGLAVLVGLLVLLLGARLVASQLRPGRRWQRRRSDLVLTEGPDGDAVLVGPALSRAIARDLTHIPEVIDADVATWDADEGTRLDARVGVHRGRLAGDVRAGVAAALDRAEACLGRDLVDAEVCLDVRDEPDARVH